MARIEVVWETDVPGVHVQGVLRERCRWRPVPGIWHGFCSPGVRPNCEKPRQTNHLCSTVIEAVGGVSEQSEENMTDIANDTNGLVQLERERERQSSPSLESRSKLVLSMVREEIDMPAAYGQRELVEFLHQTMKPWEDTEEDIHRALEYCFSDAEGKGGFIVLATVDDTLAGALVMLETGMGGYVPGYILLFVSVAPALRGQGLGRRLIETALEACDGDVKLHVEYDNPAKRLYERVGFASKYAEMRRVCK